MRKYSFVIPAYQNKKTLLNTLKALEFLETTKDISFEVIVADDGSSDGTYEMLKTAEFNYQLKSVYIPRTEKSCRSKARNEAIRKISGDVAVFIDSDILVKPNYLIILEKFYKTDSNIIVSGFRKLINQPIDISCVENKSIFSEEFQKTLKTGRDFRHEILKEISYNAACLDAPFLYALSCNLAVPKKWIDKVGFFDEELIKWGIEDVEWVYRLYKSGLKIVFNTKSEVLHQFHGVVEGNVIKKSQINDVDYNASVFIKKHPNFCGLDDLKVYKLFHSIATNYKFVEHPKRKNNVFVDFKSIDDYPEILNKIKECSKLSNTNVIIKDYVLTTDLDIIVQLLKNPKADFRYFPMNKTD